MADILNRQDVDFLLHDWLKVDGLLAAPLYAETSRETIDALIDLAETIAETKFLNHYKAADANEPQMTAEGGAQILPEIAEGVRAFAEAGFMAAPFAAEHGGLQVPQLVYQAAMAHFYAANVATAAYPMLATANARLIAAFGTPTQVAKFALPALEGRHLGTMCLSEPQAGSSLADVRTRAVADGEDALGARYRLTGSKMWISAGEHDITPNIVHLVLAKVVGPDGRLPVGTKGISLFIVPRLLDDGAGGTTRNDIALAGLNHKMGYRGTTNTLLNFGEGRAEPFGAAGAVGYLVGQEGDGLPQMFQMMNEARIGVGLGAAALGYRGYRLAVRYAQERQQGRTGRDPAAAPVPIIEHADVKRQLLTAKTYAEGALALVLYCAKLVDETLVGDGRDEAEALLGLLTPIAKTWPSEYGLLANDIAIQVHGGYGYTRDFDVEQLYRDNRLNPIHEGTTGIQGLDLLGRKVLRDRGGAFALLRARIAATIAAAREADGLGDAAAALEALDASLGEAVETLLGTADSAAAMWNATPFLWAMGHVVVAWLWLDQAVAAGRADVDSAFAAGKHAAARFFLEVEGPRVAPWLALVVRGSDTAAALGAASF
ncbi:acyl-CoA dehydrogenase [Sphingomonas jatrophae]|uniref:Acyl-CoA dehydrogenase n=1 Tax=Sphingomonas jatrophae TaxID=1166337 RepID=A0A1I6M4K0_9SPHN|nr:acyl-CoA dehydrogenase [Sphingomonas jatrophae]SFS10583.1 Acyl-CoA dehydrogenase [Sphingomonas jatrophae]